MRHSTVLTLMQAEPDERGRFLIFTDGYLESWSIERIKRAVMVEGFTLVERFEGMVAR